MLKFVVVLLIVALNFEWGTANYILNPASALLEKGATCNCVETSLVEMPTDAKTCAQSDFSDDLRKTLKENYERIQKELNGTKCECDFGDVQQALKKISAQIKRIIKILSACGRNEKMLNCSIDRYDEMKKEYNLAIRRATANQSSECGKALARIRPILLNCAENIMAAVLKCLDFEKS